MCFFIEDIEKNSLQIVIQVILIVDFMYFKPYSIQFFLFLNTVHPIVKQYFFYKKKGAYIKDCKYCKNAVVGKISGSEPKRAFTF